ncbi:hypothetical protein H6F74_26460 [Trichocoleus sp. FACHB-90]|nr:hypothetical protein [Trichocoleus sp. FACHB-90]
MHGSVRFELGCVPGTSILGNACGAILLDPYILNCSFPLIFVLLNSCHTIFFAIAMPKPETNTSGEPNFTDLNSPASAEIKQLISNLQQSHHLRSKMMNLEAWALAETMDHFLPGFWSRFLDNRRTAMKQFLERKRTERSSEAATTNPPTDGIGIPQNPQDALPK